MELTRETLLDIVSAAHEGTKNCLNEDLNYMYQRLGDAAHHLYCLAATVPPVPEGD